MLLNIITPNIRSIYLTAAYNSIKPFVKDDNIRWYIVNDFQHNFLKQKDRENNEEFYREWLKESWVSVYYHEDHCWGHPQRNFALDLITDGWVLFLDDDNIMHSEFYPEFAHFMDNPDLDAMIFKLANANGIIEAKPENIGVGTIDIVQYVLKRSYIGDNRLSPPYCADGLFIHNLYHNDPLKRYMFVNDKIRCYHNFCRSPLIFSEK